ncbi:MAG: glycosyltransferase, partial [Candidatus Omnitrophica bacterium]|nr:glycosyltransferase [Candidatus Omnitrophota bacterium]
YIKFTGLRKDIPDLINAMDICVLSSHYEGLPNVIMEYMACSKPVIATRVGGCPELVVEGKTGYLVPPKNPKALADKIVALLKDKTLRVVMGRAGRKRVEDLFTSQRMAQETEQLYESLVQPRIAYILSQFPETHETFILREIRALKQKQVGIKILSMKPCRDKVIHDEARELIGETVYGHVNVLSIVYCVLSKPIRTFRALLYIFKTYGKNPKELIKALYVLFECFYFLRVIKKENIRHIHSHWATMPTTAAMVLSKLTGIPFSFTAHAWDIFVNPDGLDEKIKRARCVVTCTDYNRRFLTYFCKNGEQNKIHLNYHGIEIASVASLPRNDTLNENLGTVPKKRGQSLRILAIGRLVETKGFEYLIEACKILKDKEIPFECKIVGEGPLRRSLHAAAVSLKLRDKIKFLGIQTQGQIKQLFSEATMLVQPSVMARNGDRDGIPNVILEALAYGVPVIATNFSGIPEAVIHAKTGILVPDRDSSALANAIIELHNDCYLTDKLINEARTLVEERFNTQRNVEELIGIFQKYNII